MAAAAAAERSLIIEKRQNGFHSLFGGGKVEKNPVRFNYSFRPVRCLLKRRNRRVQKKSLMKTRQSSG